VAGYRCSARGPAPGPYERPPTTDHPGLMTITINHYLIVSFLLFSVGFLGVLVRRNLLTVLMSIELMMNAVNLNLVAFSRRLSDLTGQVFSVFVITIAAGEAAIGLALTISLFRQRNTLNVEEADTMRG